MRTFMHLTNTCTGTCESNTNGIICTQKHSSVTACATSSGGGGSPKASRAVAKPCASRARFASVSVSMR